MQIKTTIKCDCAPVVVSKTVPSARMWSIPKASHIAGDGVKCTTMLENSLAASEKVKHTPAM